MEMSDYEFVRELAKGSFGSIRMVERKEDGEKFVIKKQKIDVYDFAKNEVAIMSKLHHPNVAAFYNSWEEDDDSYILMEYVPGFTMYNLIEEIYCDNCSPNTEEEALDFFAQITLAVNHMHQRDIMHRDLKPENVLLTGPLKVVKVVDFGISRDVSSDLEVCVLNPNDYTAPENQSEDEAHTFKSDIWSIGALLYEYYTNYRPSELRDNLELLEDLPDALKSILQKVLITSPDERPDSDEILRYAELRQPLKDYCSHAESPGKEIIKEQVQDIIDDNEVD